MISSILTKQPISDNLLSNIETIPKPSFAEIESIINFLYFSSKICSGYFEKGNTTKFKGNIGIIDFIVYRKMPKNN